METNDRPYKDPALREALGRIGGEANEDSLPDGFEESVMGEILIPHHNRRRYRVAAAFIGVLMLSGIAFAAVQWLASPSPSEEVAPSPSGREGVSIAPDNPPSLEETSVDSVRIFADTPLDEMARELAAYYNKVADIRNAEAHDVRLYYKWGLKDSLEHVVSDLNHFDRVCLTVEDNKLIVESRK